VSDQQVEKCNWSRISCNWSGMLTNLHKSSRRLALGGFLLVPIFWFADAYIDFYVFKESDSFVSALTEPEPVELWMRLLVSFMVVTFGIYAAFLLDRTEQIAY